MPPLIDDPHDAVPLNDRVNAARNRRLAIDRDPTLALDGDIGLPDRRHQAGLPRTLIVAAAVVAIPLLTMWIL